MNEYPVVKRITLNRYRFPLENLEAPVLGWMFEPGAKSAVSAVSVRIDTVIGLSGEYFSIAPGPYDQMKFIAPILIGTNGLDRVRFYNHAKVMLRKQDKMGFGREVL